MAMTGYHPLIEQALDAEDRGDQPAAEAALRQLLAEDPSHHDARHLLGGILNDREQWAEASALLGPLVAEEPNRLGARVHLAQAQLALGDIAAAYDHASACFAKAPQEALISDIMARAARASQNHHRLGEALIALAPHHSPQGPTFVRAAAAFGTAGDEELARKCLSAAKDHGANMTDILRTSFALSEAAQRWSEAVQTATQWQALAPDNPDAAEALSKAWFELGDLDRAAAAYAPILNSERGPTPEQSLTYGLLALQTQDLDGAEHHLHTAQKALGPRPDLLAGLARLKTFEGATEDAQSYCLEALAIEPDNARALTQLTIVTRGKVPAPHDQAICQLAADPAQPETIRHAMEFAAADIAHTNGDIEKAWQLYQSGNDGRAQQAEQRGQSFDPEAAKTTIETLRAHPLAGESNTDQGPEIVFIVGFPRSGTTLMERVATRTPTIAAGGELTGGAWVQHRLLNNSGKASLSTEELRDLYTDRLPTRLRETDRFTDKAPMNGMVMTQLAALFPKAKFLWCQRKGFDVASSIYRHQFPFAYDWAHHLDDIAVFMPIYAEWMAEQADQLKDRVLAVDYDRFVEEPANGARAIARWLNLDEQALQTDRAAGQTRVATFSSVQVREPISKTASVGGNAYRKHAGPIAEQIDTRLTQIYGQSNVQRVP